MKEIRILHTADWHADSDPKKLEKLESSLNQIVDYCRNNKVNAIVHSGDVWEKRQSHDQKSGVPLVYEKLRELSHLVDFIFITKGNNSHDEPGSIKLLHQLEPNIYAYEYPVVLSVMTDGDVPVVDLLRIDCAGDPRADYIVSLVPYPQKSGFLTETSIDNNNADFLEKFEQLFELIGDVTQPFTCPKILGLHANVVGSRLSTGQTLVSQDIMVAPATIEKAQHDYYGLGHIHLRQELKPNMVYSGSIYNKSWGETEQKSFEVIYFDEVHNNAFLGCESKQIMLESSRPMIKIDAEFIDGDFKWDLSITDNDDNTNAEFRFRCTVKENDRKLITEEKIDFLKSFFGEDVKIEFNIIPDERESRSEAIMHAKTLLDEVFEYAKVIEFDNLVIINATDSIHGADEVLDLPDSIKEKVLSLQNEEVFV